MRNAVTRRKLATGLRVGLLAFLASGSTTTPAWSTEPTAPIGFKTSKTTFRSTVLVDPGRYAGVNLTQRVMKQGQLLGTFPLGAFAVEGKPGRRKRVRVPLNLSGLGLLADGAYNLTLVADGIPGMLPGAPYRSQRHLHFVVINGVAKRVGLRGYSALTDPVITTVRGPRQIGAVAAGPAPDPQGSSAELIEASANTGDLSDQSEVGQN